MTPFEQHWMLKVWILLFSLMYQANCLLPAPQNVTIVSFNMEHYLTWTPGPGTPSFTHFRVQKCCKKGKLWAPVLKCSDLGAGESCDLSASFKDIYSFHLARVQAFIPDQESNWTCSQLFYPLLDTTLDSVEVELTGCGNCLLLQLIPPKIKGLGDRELEYLFNREYAVNVSRTRDKAQFVTRATLGENLISYLERGVEYCVTVLPSTFLKNVAVPSGPHCAYTSPAPVNKGEIPTAKARDVLDSNKQILVTDLLGAYLAIADQQRTRQVVIKTVTPLTVYVFVATLSIFVFLVLPFCVALIYTGLLDKLHKLLPSALLKMLGLFETLLKEDVQQQVKTKCVTTEQD